jgi:hypothetical protein
VTVDPNFTRGEKKEGKGKEVGSAIDAIKHVREPPPPPTLVEEKRSTLPMQPIGNELNTKGIRERKEKKEKSLADDSLGGILFGVDDNLSPSCRSFSEWKGGLFVSLFYFNFCFPWQTCVREGQRGTCISLIGTRTRSAKSAQEEQKKRREN